MAMNVKKGDTVVVLSGKDKGRQGKVQSTIPAQAKVVVEYIRYLNQYVTELNDPIPQLKFLEEIFQRMKQEPLPVSREEFENRAVLYHILMDLEEFLIFKKRFVYKEGLAT